MKLNVGTMRITGTLLAFGLMNFTFINTAAVAAPHKSEKQAGAENQNAVPSATASVLQVTGTTNNFTVSAQHADVLSLLKLVFDQAHRQFVPDASVTGDVTFALSGQRFDTVLAAICRQTFLRYEIDKQGIYQFRRDEEALRNLLLKTQAINNVLSEQLRGMGYAVPATPFGTNDTNRNRGMQGGLGEPGGAGNGPAGGFGGGGGVGRNFGRNDLNSAGRRTRKADASAPPAPIAVPDGADASKRSLKTGKVALPDNADAKTEGARKPESHSGTDAPPKLSSVNGPRGDRGETGEAGPAGQSLMPQTGGLAGGVNRDSQRNVFDSLSSDVDLSNNGQYQTFMKQNKFVVINTQGKQAPVQQILADLSKQAGVPILIDPDVPKGEDFVVSANIPARPLNEMLNILGYYARLEWRWVNGRIYITTTPQLQLYLRGAMLPTPGNGGNIGGGITILPQRQAVPANQAPQKKTDEAEKAKKDKKDPKDKNE